MDLNFPVTQLQITKMEGELWLKDVVRKKWLRLTPEEWVRQHLLKYFTEKLNIPANLIAVESGIKYGKLKKRIDVLVRDRNGEVWLIAECKAPFVKLSDDVISQLAVYNSSLQAPYLVITNGMSHYIFSNKGSGYEKKTEWPTFPDL